MDTQWKRSPYLPASASVSWWPQVRSAIIGPSRPSRWGLKRCLPGGSKGGRRMEDLGGG